MKNKLESKQLLEMNCQKKKCVGHKITNCAIDNEI